MEKSWKKTGFDKFLIKFDNEGKKETYQVSLLVMSILSLFLTKSDNEAFLVKRYFQGMLPKERKEKLISLITKGPPYFLCVTHAHLYAHATPKRYQRYQMYAKALVSLVYMSFSFVITTLSNALKALVIKENRNLSNFNWNNFFNYWNLPIFEL